MDYGLCHFLGKASFNCFIVSDGECGIGNTALLYHFWYCYFSLTYETIVKNLRPVRITLASRFLSSVRSFSKEHLYVRRSDTDLQ